MASGGGRGAELSFDEDENAYESDDLHTTRSMPPNVLAASSLSSTSPKPGLLPSSDASTSDSPPPNDLFLGSSSSALGLNGGFGTTASSPDGGPYSCVSCHRKFPNAKLLQQHNQSFHADKQFVCETCGKAFRFRSNLAEHRSVHTAIKPFVCRFCGKSSRLKGNLTKHILKHHKEEQNAFIGTDDIIIKKGKKSIKDPVAIDFLEKSMIVLNGSSATSSAGGSGARGSPQPPEGVDVGLDLLTTPSIEEQQRRFLMTLGLEPSAIGIKAESPDSDSSGSGGHNRSSAASTANDQLLEKCNAAFAALEGESGSESGHPGDFLSQFGVTDVNTNSVLSTLASIVANNNNTMSTPRPSSSSAINLNMNSNSNKTSGASASSSSATIEESILETMNRMAAAASSTSSAAAAGSSSGGGGGAGGSLRRAQCPECGKHMRKPKDLVTHLSTIHRLSPEQIAHLTGDAANNTSATSLDTSGGAGSSSSASASMLFNTSTSSSGSDVQGYLTQELKHINKGLVELKSQRHFAQLTQMMNSLDSRMGRLEKQVEMILNTLYTLVQLQSGSIANLS